nr:PREDICTED: adenylyl cyclase-associated protein 2 [Latimeria chalumnae]|eukprot:XP_014350514.1 PREDICTED: adenylyl cyclase-associated protein 2 [Latimeria chalumnae]
MAELQGLVERLEKAVVRLESVSEKLHGPASDDIVNGVNGGLMPYVDAFDRLLSGAVAEYLKNSKVLGGDVEVHAEMVHAAFQAQRSFILIASKHQQPAENEMPMLLKPISEKICEIQNFRERNRGSKVFNHLSAVSESIPALGWIAVDPKPGPYVKEMNDAATFYTNRVLKGYKDTDKRHVDWVKSYLNIWTELQAYIKEHHTTGLSWSKMGPIASAQSTSSAPSGGPCPPPPPGPPPVFEAETPKADSSLARSALFAQLNQGETITKGLCPLSDGPENKAGRGEAAVRKEYQDDVPNLTISETELKQVAYIFNCNRSTLQIKGKLNSIIVDNCKKLGLVFDNVVGIVEIINSRDIQLQVLGKVPTISINKTEGCHVYLSEESLKCEIVSAKSSEMNILIPQDDDYREFPVPEQFKTIWDGSKLVTEAAEIVG